MDELEVIPLGSKNALDYEHQNTWTGAYYEVDKATISKGAKLNYFASNIQIQYKLRCSTQHEITHMSEQKKG